MGFIIRHRSQRRGDVTQLPQFRRPGGLLPPHIGRLQTVKEKANADRIGIFPSFYINMNQESSTQNEGVYFDRVSLNISSKPEISAKHKRVQSYFALYSYIMIERFT